MPPAAIPSGEPVKTVRQKIWAGYYKAEVHERYYNRMADILDWVGVLSTITLAAASISALATAAYMVNSKSTKKPKLWLLWLEGSITIIAVVLALCNFGKIADMHRTAANEWRSLASDWDQAREERKNATDEQLSTIYDSLKKREQTIEEDVEPTIYSRWYLRKTQRDYNRYLGINS